MKNFLTNILSHSLGTSPQMVAYPETEHHPPLINLNDIDACSKCSIRRPTDYAVCNHVGLIIETAVPIRVLDYETFISPKYEHLDKPKHCDVVITDNITTARKIVLCDFTCRPQNQVDNPSSLSYMPTGKREYAFLQMQTTLNTWKGYDPTASFLVPFTRRVFLFAWRDPLVSNIPIDMAADAMRTFAMSTSVSSDGVVKCGTTTDGFEKWQVLYDAHYQW